MQVHHLLLKHPVSGEPKLPLSADRNPRNSFKHPTLNPFPCTSNLKWRVAKGSAKRSLNRCVSIKCWSKKCSMSSKSNKNLKQLLLSCFQANGIRQRFASCLWFRFLQSRTNSRLSTCMYRCFGRVQRVHDRDVEPGSLPGNPAPDDVSSLFRWKTRLEVCPRHLGPLI